ncbi:MAG: hypothetical protein WB782_06455 [Thermoplasmata archaeon]
MRSSHTDEIDATERPSARRFEPGNSILPRGSLVAREQEDVR